jgi:hypothetical protein
MAADNITVSNDDLCESCHTVKRRKIMPMPSGRVHLYADVSGNQRREQCKSVGRYVMRHREIHILVTDLTPTIHRAVFDDRNEPKIDDTEAPLQLVYHAQVMDDRTTISVKADTTLNQVLKLNGSVLHVEELAMTNAQLMRLLD